MPTRGSFFNDAVFSSTPHSKQNLSHSVKSSFDAGKLIPITWFEAYPGETHIIDVGAMVRTQALLTPMFEEQKLRLRVFKIPYRILASYDDFQRAFTGGESGTNHINFPMAQISTAQCKIGTLYDYLGLPLPYEYDEDSGKWEFAGDTYDDTFDASVWPFLAYHRIYNDAYRNEETENAVVDTFSESLQGFGTPFSDLDSCNPESFELCDYNGNAMYSLDELHRVGWARDYFTSALKNSQRGNQVVVNLTGNAKVTIPSANVYASGQSTPSSGSTYNGNQIILGTGTDRAMQTSNASGTGNGGTVKLVGTADMSSLTGIGAIALRTAMNVQALLEKFNVSGYRLDEQDFAIFGVSGDMRKSKAICCGGIQIPINVSEVTQTSASADDSTPLATLAGKGSANSGGHLATVHCGERCLVMVVASITPNVGLASQGLERKWTRRNYLDYYWPDLQTIGEQEIKNQEVFFTFPGSAGYRSGINDETWAYQQRYADLKYMPDVVRGDFRTTLSYWHQARIFPYLPAFNDNFIKCDPSDRIFAVSDGLSDQHYLGWFYFKIKSIRPMSKYIFSKLW